MRYGRTWWRAKKNNSARRFPMNAAAVFHAYVKSVLIARSLV